MEEMDPKTLMEWLSNGQDAERDMQLLALEQLCMTLLMSNNIDRCFESYPPRLFLPAICEIFLDESAPDNVLEVTARAITFYLDISAECIKRIIAIEGALKAICNRLVITDKNSRTNIDLAEQCCKVLELICIRQAEEVFEAGGLSSVLLFINDVGSYVHKDTLRSAMNVISKLCSKMGPNQASLSSCVKCLSTMLKYDDTHISNAALECFVSLSNRFTRDGIDHALLAQHGLLNELLLRLYSAAGPAVMNIGTSGLNASSSTTEVKSSQSTSTVISLLTTLCHGSKSVSHDLFRSNLADVIEKALKGDEKCCFDTMQLVDLLLTLLFEGHDSILWRTVACANNGSLPKISSAIKFKSRLIDSIRNKDLKNFMEIIISDEIDVNSVDEVGQTLLNWASAFGTKEIVEYLCSKGANVNKGYRSSSLHYAACFGKSSIAEVLLKYGANPEIRDNDGKTPAEKARERMGVEHHEVLTVLESPKWKLSSKNKTIGSNESKEPKGDPEMAPLYLKRLIPIFCHTYQSNMHPLIRTKSLCLIKKMAHYIKPDLLEDICKSDCPKNFASLLVEVLATVLDNENNYDGQLIALQIMYDLLIKCQDIFLDHFSSLGVFCKVQQLTGYDDSSKNNKDKQVDLRQYDVNDAKKIQPKYAYHWKDWFFYHVEDCLYAWNNYVVLELSNCSNGWFRFIVNDKLSTMYSMGISEEPDANNTRVPDQLASDELESAFIEKYLLSTSCVKPNTISKPMLSIPGANRVEVCNWIFILMNNNELRIKNSENLQQITTLHCETLGFSFQSNRGKKYVFTDLNPLKSNINSGWKTVKKANLLPTKSETVGQKIQKQAKDIYDKFFKAAQTHPRGVVISLSKIVTNMKSAIKNQSCIIEDSSNNQSWALNLCKVISDLQQLLMEDEGSVSAYEIHSSGLVEVLLQLLISNCHEQNNDFAELQKCRIDIFVKCFKEKKNDKSTETYASVLVQKLISVLELIERLPVYLYETPSNSYGLKILSRHIKFRLEKPAKETTLVDRTGRGLKIEPLCTVYQLENFLLKFVAKQWYESERATYKFIKKFKEGKKPMTFKHHYNFDKNGVIYWIGTNGKTLIDWVNPGKFGLMLVQCSDGPRFPYGQKEFILNRKISTPNCHTTDTKKSWFTIDLGLWLIPTDYTLRHCKGFGLSALRNWLFQMSKDGINWTTLYTHIEDQGLDETGGTATWNINIIDKKEFQGWRYVRIQQNGENSGGSHYICLSGFEIYGFVTSVCEDLGKTAEESKANFEREKRIFEAQLNKRIVDSSLLNINGQLRNQQAIHCITGDMHNITLIRSPNFIISNKNSVTRMPNSNPSLPETSNGSLCTNVPVANPDQAISAETVLSNQQLANGTVSHVMNSAYLVTPVTNTLDYPLRDLALPTSNIDSGPIVISASNDKPVSETSTPIDRSISFTRFVNADTLPSINPPNNEANSIDNNTLFTSNSQTRNVSTDTLICDANISTFNPNNLELETENRRKENQNSSNQTSVSVPNLTSNGHLMSQGDIIPMQEPLAGGSASYQKHTNFDQNNSLNNQSQVMNPMLPQISTSVPGFIKYTMSNSFSRELRQTPKIYPSLSSIDSSSSVTAITNKPFCAGDVSTISQASTSSSSEQASVENDFGTINDQALFADVEDDLEMMNDLDDTDVDYQESREEIMAKSLVYLNERACETRFNTMANTMFRTDRISGAQKKFFWDDNYVLKAKFISLIPAFDPRPGRTNVHHIANLEVIPPPENENDECPDNLNIINKEISLKLTLRGPNMPDVKDVEVELNSKWTMFHAIQKLGKLIDFGNYEKKSTQIWKPTYTIIYEVLTQEDAQGLGADPDNQWDSDLPIFPTKTQLANTDCTVDHVLQLLHELHNFSINPLISLLKPYSDDFFEMHKKDNGEMINTDIFNSKKIISKLVQQIHDPMVLSSNAFPSWCEHMIRSYSFLFSFETRHLYFNCTSFGPARSIVWLQSQRENMNQNHIGTNITFNREDPYSVTRLKHDRVPIPRDGDNILAWSRQIMLEHVERQTVLEFEFIGEEGTGLGPTLEFYSLIAAEFQRKDLCMWMCNDEMSEETSHCSWIGEKAKPPGYYVWQANGLFPAPLPQNSSCCDKAVNKFWLLGAFLAKVLQDNRLIDFPLSLPFLKLLTRAKNNELSRVLDESDLYSIDYQLAKFIKDLKVLILSKEKILLDQSLNDDEKYQQIKNLKFQCGVMDKVHLEDLSLNMIYLPLSRCFPFLSIDLVDEGHSQEVNMNNVEQYVELLSDFVLNTGIKRQLEALKTGFCRVFPIEKLNLFTPLELGQILCGQQEPTWTREDLLNYTVPKLGYDKESPGFLRLVNVLEQMNPMERKSFLQFTTGCSSLPPGGLANMHPRLTVVRKVDGGGAGSYPSVNTCVHYLKLPEYPDEETLRDRLLAATLEKGFHLN